MPKVAAKAIEIEYDTFGQDGDPVVLLISGLGSQMITWHEDFCRRLTASGFRVIRFDNRDAGLSTKLDDGARYTLSDMADDAVALLEALGVSAAHVVGASMGGMIAQQLAISHPSRVLSLTSIMSSTGAADVGGAEPEAAARLALGRAGTREERVASAVESYRVTWSDSCEFPFDEDMARWRAEATTDRCYYPQGQARQLEAIRLTGDRTEALRKLDVPAVVIHGSNDPLVRPSGGKATADAIPGAELIMIEGMGHVVDRRAWPRIVEAIVTVATRASVAA